MFRINFILRGVDRIAPWGEAPDLGLHWFGLTDSQLWITAGAQTIYEYSDAAMEYFGTGPRYNDYYLSRFLEDFSWTFPHLRESVPRTFYDLTGDFGRLADDWRDRHIDEDGDDIFDRFFDDEYQPLTQWYHDRIFDSGHLVGGPLIGCFRHGDMVKVYWESDYTLENGKSIWTSPKGVLELRYDDFVSAVNAFFNSFFEAMDRQVDDAVRKDWGEIKLDKPRLIRENGERKEDFRQMLEWLSSSGGDTDWEQVTALYGKMQEEMR